MLFNTYGHKYNGENVCIYESNDLGDAKWHMNDAQNNEEFEWAFTVFTTSSAIVGFKYFDRTDLEDKKKLYKKSINCLRKE